MIRGGMVTLRVAEVDRAVRFYIETLGMKLVEETSGASVIDAGEGFLIELRQGTSQASHLTLFPKVPIEEAIAIYENRGVTFIVDREGERVVAEFHDPDGNVLRLTPAFVA